MSVVALYWLLSALERIAPPDHFYDFLKKEKLVVFFCLFTFHLWTLVAASAWKLFYYAVRAMLCDNTWMYVRYHFSMLYMRFLQALVPTILLVMGFMEFNMLHDIRELRKIVSEC